MDSPETLHSVQLLHALGRKASLRERVVCTAAVYVRRSLYAWGSLQGAEGKLLQLITTALWMACKVEEVPVSPAVLLDAVCKIAPGVQLRSHAKKARRPYGAASRALCFF